MSLHRVAVCAVLAASLTSCKGSSPAPTASPSLPPVHRRAVEPKTEAGLRASGQEMLDAFAAGDWGAVWDRMDRSSQTFISRDEYIRYLKACPDPLQGLRYTIEHIRRDNDESWVMRVGRGGLLVSLPARYEEGRWVFPLTDAARTNFGRPFEEYAASC